MALRQAQDEPLRSRSTQDEYAPWVAAALRLISGSVQVAQSAGRVQRLAAGQGDAGSQTQPPAAVPAKAANRPAPPRERLFGNVYVHPTTVLGVQAVVATGLAMLAARLLNVDHSNWVFWTAFAVIAGSTGESLRKMMLRVLGTVAGATIGVALALATPDNTVLVALVATACIFLTIYFWPISYPQMVFWLNIGFVMVYARLGAQEMDLLFARPSTTLLGALVAALVVVFVFPIRTADRFRSGRGPLSGRGGRLRRRLRRYSDGRRWPAPRRRASAGGSRLRAGGTDIARRRVREQSDAAGAEPDHPAGDPDHRAGGRGQPPGRCDIRAPSPAQRAQPPGCAPCRHGFTPTSRRSHPC